MRNFKTFLVIMTAALLSACGSNGSTEVAETSAVSKTTSVTTATTAETTETTTATTAADPREELPVAIPSDEVYELYPVRLIYSGEEKELTVEKASVSDEVRTEDGALIYSFSAEYPVFTLDNMAAADKINQTIKNYVTDELEKGRRFGEKELTARGLDELLTYGYYYKNAVLYDDLAAAWDHCNYSVNGDLLSVYLEYYDCGPGAVHGTNYPINFVFDMKTGETVDFGSIIADKDGFYEAVMKGIFLYYSGGGSAEEYEEYVRDDELDNIKKDDLTYRITVADGAIGYFLATYEHGIYADGIRCIRIPISEAVAYFTDEGKELFGSTVSAEAVPAKIIEYQGEQYTEVGRYHPSFSRKRLTEGDYELMSLFPEAKFFNLTQCSSIDFERIAAMENIKQLNLHGCKFDDISPLFGSNIDYISGSGYNIPQEQADEFIAKGGRYISSDLIKENNTEANNEKDN